MPRLVRKYDIAKQEFEDVEEPDFDIPEVLLPAEPISDRQFFQQLAIAGHITEAEALAAVATGTLPAAVETIVIGMPIDDQFSARMLLSGATKFERNHPLVGVFASALDMSVLELDIFWSAASTL